MKNKIRWNKFTRKLLLWLFWYSPDWLARKILDFLYGDDKQEL